MSAAVEGAPEVWVERQFGDADLGDRRRTRRAVKVAVGMARLPGGSTPAQAGLWKDTKASYRLFDCDEATHSALIEPHVKQTRREANLRPTVLMVQDTSDLSFSGRSTIDGLGPIGNGQGQGFVMHSTLAIDPSGEGEILGLAHQTLLCRDGIHPKETKTQRKRRWRESQMWLQSVAAVGRPASNVQWVHVCDRYADFFEMFDACRTMGVDCVIRLAQDRRCSPGHAAAEPDTHLIQWARSLPACGETILTLRARPKRKARVATLCLAYSEVTLFEPKIGGRGAPPIHGWVVRVWEPDPPADEEPIEWVLLSTVSVKEVAEAKRIIDWYSCRWLIEEYHKCLKTGCRVEARQLETRQRMEACIGMLAVLAVRLLALKLVARRDPKAAAKPHVSDLHIRVLSAYRNKKPTASITAYEFWREVAKLGGFLARKGDGEPGWQTLWLGWLQLEAMTVGAELYQERIARYG
jgi:hypothetical protein